jgi:hypothetical protein
MAALGISPQRAEHPFARIGRPIDQIDPEAAPFSGAQGTISAWL